MSVEPLLQPDQEYSNDRYTIVKLIGAGGMQQVYRATDTLMNRDVALKTPINDSAAKRFLSSAKLSAKVNHPNVAKTLDYFEEGGRQFLIEELIDGEDLKVFIERFATVFPEDFNEEDLDDPDEDNKIRNSFDPYFVACVFHRLAKGLEASHAAKVIHRDLKPSNIMVIGGDKFEGIKLTDFGIAKLAEEEMAQLRKGDKLEATIKKSSTMFGALPYASPEWARNSSLAKEPSDVWAIASICAEMLLGRKPFNESFLAVPRIMKAAHYALPAWLREHPQFCHLAIELMEIFEKCWQIQPSKRPDAKTLVAMAGQLCYQPIEREFGSVQKYTRRTNGIITARNGSEIFFHTDNVCHQTILPVNTPVWFSKSPGVPNPRALPIIPVNPT